MGMEASNGGWFWFSSARTLLKGEAEKWKKRASQASGYIIGGNSNQFSPFEPFQMNKPTSGSTLRMESRQRWLWPFCILRSIHLLLVPSQPTAYTPGPTFCQPWSLSFNLCHFHGQQLAAAVPASQHSWFQTQILSTLSVRSTEGKWQHIKWVKVWVNWVCHGQILHLSSVVLPNSDAVVCPGSLLLLWYIWAM